MALKLPKMAQKLAPAKKIAEIYLQYLQLFASLCGFVFWTKNNYHCSQISAKTFVKSELRIQEMQIRFPLAKSPGVEIASSQVLSAKPTGCRQRVVSHRVGEILRRRNRGKEKIVFQEEDF